MSFSNLGLIVPLLNALTEKGYSAPSPIQLKTIPAILAGRDVLGTAQTGTGKTAGFTLPLLQNLLNGPKAKSNHVRALVLVPTRELAMQVAEFVAAYGKYLPLTSTVAYGGVKINPQMMKLRPGIDILVATPGRLLDLSRQNAVKFSQIEMLVLDEADRMLDLGFIDDIHKILSLLPPKRQNLLFSATFSTHIRSLTTSLLHNPVRIEASPRNSAAKSVKQFIYEVDKSKKLSLLCNLLKKNNWQQVLAFRGTKNGADQLVKKLNGAGISAMAIHGDKSQGARTKALKEFTARAVRVLVATDIASRGLDISELSHVINVDLPKVAENYIHRIGRTGRAGLEGVAISLVSADEVKLLSAIETILGKLLVREVVAGYVPKHGVPLTQLMKPRPKKPKKPKKVTSVASTVQNNTTLSVTGTDTEKKIHKKPRWSGVPKDETSSSKKSTRKKRRT